MNSKSSEDSEWVLAMMERRIEGCQRRIESLTGSCYQGRREEQVVLGKSMVGALGGVELNLPARSIHKHTATRRISI